MKESSKGKSALSGGHKKSKHPHEIHIRRGKSGGFVVKHHHKPSEDGQMQEPEEHVVPDLDSLQSHIQENMGDQPSVGGAPQGGDPSQGGAAPAAPQAAAPAAPAM